MVSYDLERFVTAQDSDAVYAQALVELHKGRKVSHWMWFVFPQLAGLGRSAIAQRYAIRSLGEGVAYLSHPVLGPRLLECTAAVVGLSGRSAEQIFGGVDALKLRSSMTLFNAIAAPEETVFARVLDQYFSAKPDPTTVKLISDLPPQE